MIDFNPAFQMILTIVGVAGLIAIFFVAFKTRLPQETIRNLEESNKSKESLIGDLRIELDKVKIDVQNLQAENRIIKQLPLQKIADTQNQILELLKTQNDILNKMSLTPAVQVNNK